MDLPIRFIYTRIPIVRDIVQKLSFDKLYRSSNEKVYGNYKLITDVYKKHKLSFKNKVVMEVGPGTSLVLALGLLNQGAKKIILLDRFPRWDFNIITREVNFLENDCGMKVRQFLDNELKPKNEFFQYVKNSVESISDVESDSVDLITSFGVLEHIRDSDAAFREMKRILKSGGYMYHFISLGDHYNFKDPLVFLKYSDYIWNCITKEGYSFTNRLRIDDYMEILDKNQFSIIDCRNKLCAVEKLRKVNKKFQNKSSEVLRTTHSYILARK